MVQKTRKLPDWIKAYLEYSSYSEAPPAFHFWTAVSTLAGALRRKVYIDQKYFQWTPNFYIILVAPPGMVNKSTSIDIGISILYDIKGIKLGSNALTWQALVTEMAAATEGVAVGDGLYHPMSCLTYAASELGTLLDPDDRKLLDVLVDLWDSKPGVWRKSTRTAGEDNIANPWINIIAGTTPKWIAAHMPTHVIGGGFASRCLFVYERKKHKLVPYPADAVPPNIDAQRADLLHDLEIISFMQGEYTLTDEAKAFGVEWYRTHFEQAAIGDLSNGDFGGYIARKQSHIHKLAMVLSASCSDGLVITAEQLRNAERLVTALEEFMPQVYSEVNLNPMKASTKQIVSVVQGKGSILRTALYRMFFPMASKDFDDALTSAVTAGYVRITQRGSQIFIERAREIGDNPGTFDNTASG